jgi:hypothetical protein
MTVIDVAEFYATQPASRFLSLVESWELIGVHLSCATALLSCVDSRLRVLPLGVRRLCGEMILQLTRVLERKASPKGLPASLRAFQMPDYSRLPKAKRALVDALTFIGSRIETLMSIRASERILPGEACSDILEDIEEGEARLRSARTLADYAGTVPFLDTARARITWKEIEATAEATKSLWRTGTWVVMGFDNHIADRLSLADKFPRSMQKNPQHQFYLALLDELKGAGKYLDLDTVAQLRLIGTELIMRGNTALIGETLKPLVAEMIQVFP